MNKLCLWVAYWGIPLNTKKLVSEIKIVTNFSAEMISACFKKSSCTINYRCIYIERLLAENQVTLLLKKVECYTLWKCPFDFPSLRSYGGLVFHKNSWFLDNGSKNYISYGRKFPITCLNFPTWFLHTVWE